MSIERLMVIPATVTPRVPADDPDEYNDEVLEDGTAFDTVCWLAYVDVAENPQGNVVGATRKLFFLADDYSRLSATAKVAVRGETLELVGDPWLSHTPRGPHHVEVFAKRAS